MFQVLAHPDLFHQLVLVPIHPGQLSNMSENILQSIGQLEGIHIIQTVLNMRIHNQFRQSQNFPAQMKSITKPRLFTLFRCQSLDRFQVEIVIQMQVVQVLPMDQEVQHVVPLTANLEADLDPIQSRGLEEFSGLERSEQVPLFLRLWRPVMQSIEDIVFQQFLITDSNLNRLSWRTMLAVPTLD